MRAAPGLLIFSAALLGACPIWNGSQDDVQPVGSTAVALPLDKSINRAQESLFGDLGADAYLAAGADAGAVAALFNGGSIRCEQPSFPANADNSGCRGLAVDAGPIDAQLLQDTLPFESENQLVIVLLTAAELRSTLERSLSALPQEASGWFLQVAGLSYVADCAKAAQVIDPNYPAVLSVVSEGQRVTSITLAGKALDLTDSVTAYPVVTNSFEAAGNDGHVAMALACQKQGCEPFDPSATDYVEVARYLVTNSPVSPALSGRITLSAACALPPGS